MKRNGIIKGKRERERAERETVGVGGKGREAGTLGQAVSAVRGPQSI